jgi:hypothetical protein
VVSSFRDGAGRWVCPVLLDDVDRLGRLDSGLGVQQIELVVVVVVDGKQIVGGCERGSRHDRLESLSVLSVLRCDLGQGVKVTTEITIA